MNVQPNEPFWDRRTAGRELATRLQRYSLRSDVVVLALPRGGVPVAFEAAEALDAPLDIFLVRKLGLPAQPELAMGAIASGGVRLLNQDVVSWYRVPESVIDEVAAREQRELERREREYRSAGTLIPLRDRVVILVDDGLATGATMKAAVLAVRQHEPAQVIVAVPVGAPSTCEAFARFTDRTICARTPEPFSSVAQWYRHFPQTTDGEVRALLREHANRSHAERPG